MTKSTRVPVPQWMRELVREAKVSNDEAMYGFTRSQLHQYRLNTVCEGARCPNRGSCYSCGTATFMILGNSCTRNCRFCAVSHDGPQPVDQKEPERLAEAVRNMGLRHVVVTSVTRDDLADGGAAHFAAVINELAKLDPRPAVEVLTPDFKGDLAAVKVVLEAKPEVFSHNVEMVPRLYSEVRPGADYRRSLEVLSFAAKSAGPGTRIKTGFMLGLGEEAGEVLALMQDLRRIGVSMLTIGQYLAPTMDHYPVKRYATPEEFAEWEKRGYELGFASVAAGPLVRSSYHAGEYFKALHKDKHS